MIKTLFLIFLLLSSAYSQTQWELKYDIVKSLYSFDASDEYTAAAARSSEIYYTLDGGDTWNHKNLKNLISSYGSITDLTLIDKNNVWICTGDGLIIRGALNNSTVWYVQYENEKKSFCNYIKMFDLNNGIAMFDGDINKSALILRTTNGGERWTDANNDNLMGLYASGWNKVIDYYDVKNGLFSASNYMTVFPNKHPLLKTTDSGKNWEIINQNLPVYFCIVKMYDTNTIVACGVEYLPAWGSKFYFYYSTDGGLTWEKNKQPNDSRTIGSFEFVPNEPNKIWFSFNNQLYFTKDAGKTHSLQFTSDSQFLTELAFINEKVGWLVCDNGKIFKTTNGDIVGISENTSIIPTKAELYQNYPNPFNPETTISYSIPKGEHVTLKVYDLLGREVATLVDEFKQPGNYNATFNVKTLHATSLSSGIYFYRLQCGSFSETRKFALMK